VTSRRVPPRAVAGGAGGDTAGAVVTVSDVGRELRRWYNMVSGLGEDSVPPKMVVLRARAEESTVHLGVFNFSASFGFISRCAKRHNLVNVPPWGTSGSAAADAKASKQRMAENRADISAYDPEQIYNMDETGLYFLCLPSRAYVTAGSRRRALGSKAMKAKELVTLVLVVNFTKSHKISVTVVGKAAVPVGFKAPRDPHPLPYLSQKSA